MKIAIVGAGISGLATYLQLRKHLPQDHPQHLDITIFDPYPFRKKGDDDGAKQKTAIPAVGATYGLAANGMASLRRLSPSIHAHVLRNSFATPRFHMKTRQGWTLGDIPAVMATERGGVETVCMTLREVVLEALYSEVPAGVVRVRKVREVVDGHEGAVVRFGGDGEAEEEEERFDLVVGADGIWSRTRKAVAGADEKGPEYRRLATLGGFIETKHLLPVAPTSGPLPSPQSHTTMIFGPNGFFSYSPCTTSPSVANNITAAHLRGEEALAPGPLSFWWSRSSHEDPKMEPDMAVAMEELKGKLSFWKDPNIPRILEHSAKTFLIPTYVLPKQRTWTGRRVVLIGDAAHALPTASGQGVPQAFEDAEALAMLLAHHLSSSSPSDSSATSAKLQKVFADYATVRKAHVERILEIGKRAGDTAKDMNVVVEYAMYAFFWVMLKFFIRYSRKEVEDYRVVDEVKKVLK